MLVGYARISQDSQSIDLQIDALTAAACERIFSDTMSGSRNDRPGLKQALEFVRSIPVATTPNCDRRFSTMWTGSSRYEATCSIPAISPAGSSSAATAFRWSIHGVGFSGPTKWSASSRRCSRERVPRSGMTISARSIAKSKIAMIVDYSSWAPTRTHRITAGFDMPWSGRSR
jgi:hypothetical protein